MRKNIPVLKTIPNILTLFNLACGILSIITLTEGKIIPAFYLILLAAVFDFADGLSARVLNAYSDTGKQLDSLADMVSFGVAPSLLMFKFIEYSFLARQPGFAIETASWFEIAILFSSVLLALATGFRLAKFNIDPDQSFSFAGLPSPANAILIASTGIVIFSPDHSENLRQFILNPYFLFISTLILSFLLISKIPMFSLKFKHYKLTGNRVRYFFVLISLILIIIFRVKGIPLIILAYIMFSLINPSFYILKKTDDNYS